MNIENKVNLQNKELEIYELNYIKGMIYMIRGRQVILDCDIAKLYDVETKRVNEAVKRNIERFSDDFCFQLTIDELNQMWFHFGTTYEKQNIKYRSEKYLPYAYIEEGVAMLSGLLKNDIAIQMSINIIRAFIEMRKFIIANGQVFERLTNIENKLLEHDKKFDDIFERFDSNETIKQSVFFQGQIWDSYELIIDIIKTAKIKILIIDNYIDDTVLNILIAK